MYKLRRMSVNGILVEKTTFLKEIEIEALLITQPELMAPPDATIDEDSIVNQIAVPNGAACDEKRSGNDGRIDIAFRFFQNPNNKKACWAVVEVKNGELSCDHYAQLSCYLQHWKGLYRNVYEAVENRREANRQEDDESEESGFPFDAPDVDPEPRVIGILVGTSVSEELACHILNQCPQCEGNDRNFTIGAIEISRGQGDDRNQYVFSEGVFPPQPRTTRDRSKFAFDKSGTPVWSSGRGFVWEVINELARQGMVLSSPPSGLQASQGSFPVVTPTPRALSRYFRQPISQGGVDYYVANQWGFAHGTGNLARFFAEVSKLVSSGAYSLEVWRKNNSNVVSRIV